MIGMKRDICYHLSVNVHHVHHSVSYVKSLYDKLLSIALFIMMKIDLYDLHDDNYVAN